MDGPADSFRNPVPDTGRLRWSHRLSQPCRLSHTVRQIWSVHTSGRLIHPSDARSGGHRHAEAVVRPPQPGWSDSQGTQADVLRPRCSQEQLTSRSQSASPIQQRCGPATGAEESVIKMVRHREFQSVRHSLSSTGVGWGSLVSQMQLDPLSQTRPVRPRRHQPGRAVSQSAVVRLTDHRSWSVRHP